MIYINVYTINIIKKFLFLKSFRPLAKISTKFSSTKASSSSNALFACFSASFVAFEGLPLLLNCVANPNYRHFFFLYRYFNFCKYFLQKLKGTSIGISTSDGCMICNSNKTSQS